MKSAMPALMFIVLLAACNSSRNSTSASGDEAPAGQHQGTVTTAYAKEGCAHLIRLNDAAGREDPFLLPVALDPKFLKDGLELRFTYRPSRAPSGSCLKGMPAILEDVTVL